MTPAATSRSYVPTAFAAIAALFFALFLFYPIAHVVRGAFIVDGRFTLDAFRLAVNNSVFVESVRNSFLVAVTITVLASLIALPLAWVFHAYRFAGKAVFQTFMLAGLVLPPIVGSVGFRQVFARFGSLNLLLLKLGIVSEPIDFLGANPLIGVVLVGTLHLYPILFVNLQATLANIDPTLFEAAESAGASRFLRLSRIGLPLVLPGYFAGAVIVFIFALTDLGAPIVFDARMLVPIQIFERASEASRDPVGYALVLFVIVATLGSFLLARAAVKRTSPSSAAKGIVVARPRPITTKQRALLYVALCLLSALTLMPHAAVLVLSLAKSWFFTILPEHWTLAHYAHVATDEIAFLGVKNSLVYASCSTLIDIALGGAIAWLVVRRGGNFASLLDVCSMLPLALPGIVLAFGYVYAFSGSPLDVLAHPGLLLVLGYALRRLPYLVRSADAGFRQLPVALEEAARGFGASNTVVARRITLPLVAGHLLAGGILAFSFALLEVSESLILAPTKESYPIAKSIYILAGDLKNGPQIASAMGVVGSLVLLYSLFVAGRLLGRNMSDLFRS